MTESYRVNYDAVASGYSRRAAGSYLSGVTSVLQDLARQVKARRALDLGCGTGLSLQGLAANLQPAPLAYGLDFSGGMLAQAGFQQVNSPIVQYISDNLVGEAVFDSYFLRKDSCSQLILLSEEAYQAGLRKMRAKIAAAKARGKEIIFRTELKNRMCHGFKPV